MNDKTKQEQEQEVAERFDKYIRSILFEEANKIRSEKGLESLSPEDVEN